MSGDLAGRLAEYAWGLGFGDLPADVVHEAKRRVIDSLGCALGAYAAEPVKVARAVVHELGGAPAATILGSRDRSSPPLAAFVNGIMVRYLDYNDTYLSREPAHPSDNIPAALAVAESEGRSGADLITAIVLAYEIQCRLADAASIRARGWDHVTYGAFSVAASAAKLMGLDADRIRHALSLSAVAGAAMRQTRAGELSMWKGAAFANTARNAVLAALLARAGMTGPAPIFEGEFGFFRQVSGEFDPGPLGGEGVTFRITDTSIKLWPAEYHAQPGIEAALRVRERGVGVDDIDEVVIHTFRAAVEIIAKDPEKWRPRTRETADHSLPYCVAVALTDGTVTPAQFLPHRLADERIHALLARTRVVEDPGLTERYPEAVPTVLEVRLRSGETVVERVDYPRGHACNPVSDAEVEQKFLSLTGGLLSPAQQDAALARLWRLEEEEDLRALLGIPGSRLRAAWGEGCLVVPGVPDALVARMAEEAGFRCLYVSGAATANGTLGLPDIGLVTATEMADWAGRIARAVEVPVIADADTGYGNAVNVMRTVDLFERAGLAGMHLEDQVFPKRCGHVAGKRVIPVEEMVGKIRAACRARSDPGFVIIARTDARDVEGLEAAISRGKAYLDAGADALFPEALRSEEEFAHFADAFPGAVLMANVTEFGKTPLLPATVLERLGYRLVLYPLSALRVMLKAAREFLLYLRSTRSQAAYLDRMLTRAELYELVRYGCFTGWEREFLPEGGIDPLS